MTISLIDLHIYRGSQISLIAVYELTLVLADIGTAVFSVGGSEEKT